MHTSFQVSVRKTRSRWLKSKIYHKFKLKNCKQIVQTIISAKLMDKYCHLTTWESSTNR